MSIFRKHCLVKPGSTVKLTDWDPNEKFGLEKEPSNEELEQNAKLLFELQYRLYAGKKNAVLVVFQAMDTGGKDGAIRHVMTAFNPQGCTVAAFKQPTSLELEHDFLWRIHRMVPPRGNIGIFNRSQYEDVLVVRVHKLVPNQVWSARYRQINEFERLLTENGVVILKFYLHIDKDEQKKRILDRLHDPDRMWKVSPEDFTERQYWDDYRRAYEDALSRCSTEDAPWYVIPANHKWVRNVAISNILLETMNDLNLKFPPPSFDLSTVPPDF